MQFERGDVFIADLTHLSGSEASGARPVLVVSNDKSNRFSPVLTIVAATSQNIETPLPVYIKVPRNEIGNQEEFHVLCNHVYTIDKLKIKSHVGKLSTDRMNEIDAALKSHLSI